MANKRKPSRKLRFSNRRQRHLLSAAAYKMPLMRETVIVADNRAHNEASANKNNSTLIVNVEDDDDDVPSTSQGVRHSPFKKFRDDGVPLRKRQLKRLRNNQQCSKTYKKTADQQHLKSSSAVQLLSKKLLRSIRRRQNQNCIGGGNGTPHNKRDILRRKLNFQDNRKSLSNTSQIKKTNTSQKQHSTQTAAAASNSKAAEDADDCICIEKPIEQIIIDDDEQKSELKHKASLNMSESQFLNVTNISKIEADVDSAVANIAKTDATDALSKKSSGYISDESNAACQARLKLLTSTPNAQAAALLNSTAQDFSLSYAEVAALPAKAEEQPLFFEDTKPSFQASNDSQSTMVNYLSYRSTMGGKDSKPANYISISDCDEDDIVDAPLWDKHLVYFDKRTGLPAENYVNPNKHTHTLRRKNAKKRKNSSTDDEDSVIFVGVTNTKAEPFIPLVSSEVPNPIKCPAEDHSRKRKKPKTNQSLFSKSEKKQMQAYNYNTYNPSANDSSIAVGSSSSTGNSSEACKPKKRMVIIDGSNVAFNHLLNQGFSVKGLQICIKYFEKMGHEVKAVVPQFRLQRNKSTDAEELEKLHKNGKIVFTPCKNLPGKSSNSYDDRFVLQLACELDAAVVSNDNYRDLVHENPAFRKIIENRVIGYSWCNDIFILPIDPYGKWGPTLETILNRS